MADVPPSETSPAAKSEEKLMFSQARKKLGKIGDRRCMEFLSLSRRRSSARNVPSGEKRGETDASAG